MTAVVRKTEELEAQIKYLEEYIEDARPSEAKSFEAGIRGVHGALGIIRNILSTLIEIEKHRS